MAFWKRNDVVPGDLIGNDNSDEPRLTIHEAMSLDQDRINNLDRGLDSWAPLLRTRREWS